MAPVFEHPDRKNIESEFGTFAETVKDYVEGAVAKVVKSGEKSEPKSSDAEVETK